MRGYGRVGANIEPAKRIRSSGELALAALNVEQEKHAPSNTSRRRKIRRVTLGARPEHLVREEYFAQKVHESDGKNGGYLSGAARPGRKGDPIEPA